MLRSQWCIRIFAASLFMLCPHVALASDSDKSAQLLARARIKYEADTEKLRKNIDRRIMTAIDQSANAQNHIEALKKAQSDLNAFRTLGTLPKGPLKKRWTQQYAKTAERMSKAYTKAVADYTLSNNAQLRDAVATEASLFGEAWDLVPWGPNLLKTKSNDSFVTHAAAITIPLDGSEEYRIEIKAQSIKQIGELFIEFSSANGQGIKLPASTNDDGNIYVILTIRKNYISSDLGIHRPIALSQANASHATGLTLSAAEGTFQVQSVRAKPIVSKAPPKVSRPERRAKPKKKPAPHPLPIGSKWSGEVFGQSAGVRTATATVINVDNNLVTLAVTDKFGTSHWYLQLNRNSFSVYKILPKNQPDVQIKNVKGTGQVRKNKLRWDGQWLWQTVRAGASVSAHLELTRVN